MVEIDPERLALLETIDLRCGSHETRDAGMCALETLAYLVGAPHTDHPPGVSPVIAALVRYWNDAMRSDEERNHLLRPLLPRLIGTASDAVEAIRAYMALDWLVRVGTPAWLELAGLTEEAGDLRALPEITGPDSLPAANAALAPARRVNAVDNAAWANARHISDVDDAYARDELARGVARLALEVAGFDAAWAAVAWADPPHAADPVRAAAWDAAEGAAWYAIRDLTRDAAWEAAWEVLEPTVAQLQASATQLVLRMCALSEEVPA